MESAIFLAPSGASVNPAHLIFLGRQQALLASGRDRRSRINGIATRREHFDSRDALGFARRIRYLLSVRATAHHRARESCMRTRCLDAVQ
jgi:hypothetical protein